MADQQLIRGDGEAWDLAASIAAPDIWPFFKHEGLSSSSFIEALRGTSPAEDEQFLEGLLGRPPTATEKDEFENLKEASIHPARKKRAYTAAAADNPALRRKCEPVLQPLPADLPLQPGRGGVRGGAGGWWPRVGSAQRKPVDKGQDRERWARIAGDFVVMCGDSLPASEMISQSASPEELAAKLCAGRRASTIKRRMKDVLRFQRWLHEVVSPTTHWISGVRGAALLMDYLLDRAREPCAPSVPQDIITAIEFVETIGGRPQAERPSRHGMVQALGKELTVELSLGRKARAVKKAPSVLLSMLVALEMIVLDPREAPYARVYSWVKLIRHWTALRWGDLLSTPPRLSLLSPAGLELTITSTKTTGPGKKVELLKAYVGRGAWLWEPGWLEAGWKLFVGGGQATDREFFLPLEGKGDRLLSDREPRYMDACGMSRKTNSSLYEILVGRLPDGTLHVEQALDARGVRRRLLMPGVATFWTEHGDRSTLVNWASRIGLPLDTRNALGRWSPQGSDQYLRTSRTTILEAQDKLAALLRVAPDCDLLGEEDTLMRLRAFMVEREFADEAVDEQLRRLRTWRVPEVVTLADGFVMVESLPQPAPDTPRADSSDEDVPADADQAATGEWVVSQARQGRPRTLHRVGECWRIPGRHFRWWAKIDEAGALAGPAGGLYENACKDCFRESVVGAVSKGESVSAESGSGSSTDSTDSDADGSARHD